MQHNLFPFREKKTESQALLDAVVHTMHCFVVIFRWWATPPLFNLGFWWSGSDGQIRAPQRRRTKPGHVCICIETHQTVKRGGSRRVPLSGRKGRGVPRNIINLRYICLAICKSSYIFTRHQAFLPSHSQIHRDLSSIWLAEDVATRGENNVIISP